MPPTSNGEAHDADLFGLQSEAPRDAEELRQRSRRYLTEVGAALDSIESLLDSWTRLSEASAASAGAPARSDFRAVKMDSFTVLQPPPTVSDAEVTQYIQRLTKKDLKALEDEFELTCVDDFEYVSSDEDGAMADEQAASRVVHFVDDVPQAAESGTHAGLHAEVDTQEPASQAIPLSVSPTTRARTLFEGDGTSVDRLGVNSVGRVTVVESHTPPAFSLEQMSPSAVAAHERRRSASSDSSTTSALARTATAVGGDATASYTVEINYSADHFFPSAVQRALRDGAGGAIMITPGAHPATQLETTADAASCVVEAAPVHFGSDTEVSGAEDDIQSFTAFSRMVLANEGRRLTSQRARLEALPRAETKTQPPSAARHESPAAPKEATALPPPRAAAPAPTPAPVASPTQAKKAKSVDLQAARDAFVRQRVRDILLANRVRAADAATLGSAFFAKLDRGWKAAASQTTPVLHKLDDMLCESSVLLQTLEVLDHQAYQKRVMDPTQYLCVPRYTTSCAAPDCATTFSTTTTRVMCGRCGQSFCPACCVERGLGPDVVCDGQQYSLGWEPLCRLCFQMCRDSQRALVQRRHEYPRLTDNAARSIPESEDAAEEAARRASLDSLSVKQAVLFGVYCDEQRCLGDGLPPFYVMDQVANEGVVFWDVLSYRLAKTQGTLRRGWQNAGNMATSALQSAAQMVSNRRAKLRPM